MKHSISSDDILADISKFGLKVTPGICFGYHVMVIFAILCNDLPTLLARLQNGRDEIDYPIFVQAISIAHSYSQYYPLLHLNPQKTQSILRAADLIMPIALENKGGLQCIMTQSGIYDGMELLNYTFVIHRQLRQVDQHHHPFAISLGTKEHIITVALDTDKLSKKWWIFNSWDIPNFQKIDILAWELKKIFLDSLTDPSFLLLETKIYCAQSDAAYFTPIIQAIQNHTLWQQIHAVTPQKAMHMDNQSLNWLFLASKHGDLTLAKKLIHNGSSYLANIKVNPLGMAIEFEHPEMIDFLLQQKIYSPTILFDFVKTDNITFFKKMIPFFFNNKEAFEHFIHTHRRGPFSLIHIAVVSDSMHCLSYLMDNFTIDFELPLLDGLTPLMLAAEWGLHDMVKLILSASYNNINACEKTGKSAVVYAAHYGFDNILKLILSAGASANNLKSTSPSPLYLAAEYGNFLCAKILLQFNADVNVGVPGSFSPLSAAIRFHYLAIADLLIQSGAAFTASIEGNQPLLIAKEQQDYEAQVLLVREGAGLCRENFPSNNEVTVYDEKIKKMCVVPIAFLSEYFSLFPMVTKKYFYRFEKRQDELKRGVYDCIEKSFFSPPKKGLPSKSTKTHHPYLYSTVI